MRTLASIQRIAELNPIPNADAIEVANVLGWHVVVKKGEFQVGNYCVYIEIDSLLPIREEFAFLQSGGVRNMVIDGKTVSGYRLKTIRLRGQISQGICFPVTILGSKFPYASIEEGQDVTELLNIVKYEPPIPAQLAGKMRGNFPGYLPKTDETRIQTFPDVLERWGDEPFYITEKLDGSSCTFVVKNDEFHVCSRNLDLLDDGANTLWRLAKEMNIEDKLRDLGEFRIALQGEVIGEGIQGNKYKLKGQAIYFFNAYDYEKGEYMSFKHFKDLMEELKLPMVPLVDLFYSLPKSVDAIVDFVSNKKSKLNPDAQVEGYVFRPHEEKKDPNLGRLSFKVINPEFLLKNNE